MPHSPIALAIKRALPAVVSIRTISQRERSADEYAISSDNPLPYETDESQEEQLGGSGFIVSPDGLIVTNKHVVANPDASYDITLQNGKRYSASIIALDPITDVAFLKIPQRGLKAITIGTARTLTLGDEVIAIGNALGQFSNTVSAGIVSGLSRSLIAALDSDGTVEELEGLIQTDAAINPGNSGGPLINLKGEAVGINIATVLGAQSLGFAIPIDIVRRDLAELRKFGRIRRVYLGIRYIPITESIAKEFNIKEARGVLVASDAVIPAVAPKSPAARAGLQDRDIILSVNGEHITTEHTLSAILAQARIGAPLSLVVLRRGKKLRVSVIPDEWQPKESA